MLRPEVRMTRSRPVSRYLGISLLAVSLAAAGCSTPQAQPQAPAAPDAPVTPKVNRVVLATAPPGVESNEPRQLAGQTSPQLRPMYEHLVGMDPNSGKFTPQLATEWKMEGDGTSWRFKIRRGVQFHHGHGEFTSKDMVQPILEYVRQDSTGGWQGYWLRFYQAVETPSDDEVVFKLKERDGQFLQNVIEERAGGSVFSKADYASRGAESVKSVPYAGTGSYQFKERSQGQHLRYERVPYKHWRTDAEFPEFEWRWMKEASTRLAALLAGEVHIADLPEDLQPQAVKQGLKVVSGKFPSLRVFMNFYCCFLADVKDPSKGLTDPSTPLRDVRVRRALSKAVNREELNKAFFAGKGSTMVLSHFSQTRQGWNPEWERRFPAYMGFDVAAARELLAQAGYDNNNKLSTNLLIQPVGGVPSAADLTEAIAGYWRAIGVNVNLTQMDPGELTNQTRQMRLTNHINVLSTGTTQWGSSYAYVGATTTRGTKVEALEVNQPLDELQYIGDEKQQEDLWRKAGDAYFESAGSIPLFWLPGEAVVNPSIVADWLLPGGVSGQWSHLQNIKAAR